MSNDVAKLFMQEGRKKWLIGHGYHEDVINKVMVDFAQRIADGEKFGYDKNGISILSNLIRIEVVKLSIKPDVLDEVKIKPKVPWYKKLWR